MTNNPSSLDITYRHKIAEDALAQIKAGNILDLSLIDISIRLDLPIAVVKSTFNDEQEIVMYLAEQAIANHKKMSNKIIKLSGVDGLATLLKHDLNLILGFRPFSANSEIRKRFKPSTERMESYFSDEMASFYFEILRRNLDLMPNREIDISVYSHFIVHSLFFFEKQDIEDLTARAIDVNLVTRRIISMLFRSKSDSDTISSESE